jgi:hypothetical protein
MKNFKNTAIISVLILILLLLIEIMASVAIYVKYKYINNPPSTNRLADFLLLSPFFEKAETKNDRCNEIYKSALQKENREYMQEDSLLGFRLIPYTKYCYVRDSPLPAEVFITNGQGFTSIGQSSFNYNKIKDKLKVFCR